MSQVAVAGSALFEQGRESGDDESGSDLLLRRHFGKYQEVEELDEPLANVADVDVDDGFQDDDGVVDLRIVRARINCLLKKVWNLKKGSNLDLPISSLTDL